MTYERPKLYWIMKKPDMNWTVWGNKSFHTEQEAAEYLAANIAYPKECIDFRLVQEIAVYGLNFSVEKRDAP